ncbi:glycosyltransferase family 2 protein [Phytohabitans houttuyneae]|uniref:Glycosyl transferase n=1 Tax=Phytohabitans houttuyneae TaxID=1076126 RepID=A0A6V8KR89_9ACTN|nr:glycosyltransferase [Phytohabitans houttuyneae]GFJ84769.1 glycosyl transferase [Phytohabitans houttuyneae]
MRKVTVVVASHNRREQLLQTLPRHRAPVILVDNASTDGSAAAVRARFPQVRVLRLPVNAGAAARNVGVALAQTPYVAFADDDSYWDGDALEQAARALDRHPSTALLAARVLVGPTAKLDPVSAGMATAPLGTMPTQPGPSVLGFLACSAVVRREVFLAVGGFQPKLHVYGEEALLAMDLATQGWGLAYLPSLVVRHLPVPNGRDPAARRRQQIRNDLLTTWLRRPATRAVRDAARALSTSDGRAGLHDALAELPWVMRHRRRLPPHLEAALRRLETSQAAVG